MALTLSVDRCKGCGYCVIACPKSALSFDGESNKEGYQFVSVDNSSCIECGICYTVCPEIVFELNK